MTRLLAMIAVAASLIISCFQERGSRGRIRDLVIQGQSLRDSSNSCCCQQIYLIYAIAYSFVQQGCACALCAHLNRATCSKKRIKLPVAAKSTNQLV
jgi:hypothetical protein